MTRMRKIRHRHSLATILSMAVVTRAAHSNANRGWARLPPNLQSAKFLRRNIDSSAISHPRHDVPASIPLLSLRGGSSTDSNEVYDSNDDDDADEMRRKKREEYEKLVKYRTEQQMLYQLRSTYLTEMLASRGVPLHTITSVSTADGEKPPEKVDWDCALSTVDEPKSCLYSFDAEPDTKVVAPLGTDQWISLSALNRLRRTDPTKVEPMWHSRYSVLRSWFSDESEFSMLQHVGVKGFFVSSILLDGANGMVLRSLLILSVLSALVLLMPLLEYVVGRIIVSAPFWAQWTTWGRVARAGFPLKLLIGQLVWKAVASCFSKLENEVREHIVDLECEILEDNVPVTVGVRAEEEIMMEEDLEEGGTEMDSEDFDEYDEEYDDEY
mmetsp:Transcript_50372/g.107278  ORF Transcript_50372/g.107278 Transcript_50372/m.107278 type:complete len:383 (-) Transcript_50372:73-1221(-)|eukprot:CAMPEP_0172554708 /NCGR_PEP_ID=MMETSP1067-20121228/56064_1 /TAXON_ID=265564 ORGANISM="Thalassiosira punctigera, Strain Tpunct2005C2" /NCGR_SAMPLE_ID=MMETSP1067 /ASSEMBLY_ACC=CAM_ASM_000444 /LENGTH=382 /DNA_ID=CAMNT_0013343131 /DNA_START=23 /DNA_END=1171 /DNA_ORIENTATION=+